MGKFFTIWATREAQEFREKALKTIYSVSNLSFGLLDVHAERFPLSEPSLLSGYMVLCHLQTLLVSSSAKIICKEVEGAHFSASLSFTKTLLDAIVRVIQSLKVL